MLWNVPENTGMDLLRRSLQKFYARSVGGRDYGIWEAVHLGLRLPLVFPLMETVPLNTMGARRVKTNLEMRNAGDDDPVVEYSKVDTFDKRLELLNRMAMGRTAKEALADELRHMSLYELYWKLFYSSLQLFCIKRNNSLHKY